MSEKKRLTVPIALAVLVLAACGGLNPLFDAWQKTCLFNNNYLTNAKEFCECATKVLQEKVPNPTSSYDFYGDDTEVYYRCPRVRSSMPQGQRVDQTVTLGGAIP